MMFARHRHRSRASTRRCDRRGPSPLPFPPVVPNALSYIVFFAACLALFAALFGAFALGWRYGLLDTALGVVFGLVGAGLVSKWIPGGEKT